MKKVTGLGGIFFKSKDPKALYEWYRKHLGIESAADGSGAIWRDGEHPESPVFKVVAIFPADTKYFAPSDSSFMINFRVENLDWRRCGQNASKSIPRSKTTTTESSAGSRIRKVTGSSCGSPQRTVGRSPKVVWGRQNR